MFSRERWMAWWTGGAKVIHCPRQKRARSSQACITALIGSHLDLLAYQFQLVNPKLRVHGTRESAGQRRATTLSTSHI